MNTKKAKLPSTYYRVAKITMIVTPFSKESQKPSQTVTLALFLPLTRGQVPGLFRQVDEEPPSEIGSSYEDLAAAIAAEVASERERTPATTGEFWGRAAGTRGK